MADKAKKLTGEARIDALALHLKAKHGHDLPPEVLGDAEENDEAREVAGLAAKPKQHHDTKK